MVFVVPEILQGMTDLNGDGDAVDAVIHAFDRTAADVTNLGLAITSTTSVEGEIAVFTVSENNQGASDLNNDGDTGDTVLHVFDHQAGQTINLGLAGFGLSNPSTQFAFGLIATGVVEASQGGSDLNGDADTNDAVLHLVAIAPSGNTDNVREAIAALPDDAFKATGHRVAFGHLLTSVDVLIEKGMPDQARVVLGTVLSHIDGCGDSADNTDWIVDCESQVAIRSLVDQLIL